MKIGILTFHNAYNYGAVLQAYALRSFLESNGHDVEILDYHNSQVDQSYVIFKRKEIFRRNFIKAIQYVITCCFRSSLYPRFKKNSMALMNLSHSVYDLKDSAIVSKDVIVVGSDQLWNKKITGQYDPFYWAEFTKQSNVKAITYAVCMNADQLNDQDIIFIQSHLTNFDALSVREQGLADKLRQLTNQKITISLDPTLLVEPDFWKTKVKKTEEFQKKPYILVYAILEKKRVISIAKQFAKRMKMPLVVMNPIADAKPFSRYYQPDSPFGFFSAIANAEYVITSSFHGLAFSVIFHRNVWVMGDSGKNERMKSLLSSIGILDRFITNDKTHIDECNIDYSEVEDRLKVLREDSKRYLINSLISNNTNA